MPQTEIDPTFATQVAHNWTDHEKIAEIALGYVHTLGNLTNNERASAYINRLLERSADAEEFMYRLVEQFADPLSEITRNWRDRDEVVAISLNHAHALAEFKDDKSASAYIRHLFHHSSGPEDFLYRLVEHFLDLTKEPDPGW